MLSEYIYLIIGVVVGVPLTIVYLLMPPWRANNSQPTKRGSPEGRGRFLAAFAFGVVSGFGAFCFLTESHLFGVIGGLMMAVVLLAWYLLLSRGAFELGGWYPFFGFGRPVPTEMAKPLQAPIALPLLLLLAGGLFGLILHMLYQAGA